MGFYLRKTIKVGGINLNLSGSGLGVSTGIRGFRVGMNGRGTYVQMGRGGLYYRKQVSWNRSSSGAQQKARPTTPATGEYEDQNIVFTENLAQPLSVNLADVGNEQVLSHFKPQLGWTWLVFAVIGAVVTYLIYQPIGALAGLAILGGVLFQALSQSRKVLVYDLEGQALDRYETFVNDFGEFFRANRLWLYEQRSVTTDWKRNAGATNLMKRRIAQLLPSGDPLIRTNLSIPCVKSGQDSFYFLPDMIVCRSGASLTSFGYQDLEFGAATERFIEEESVPSDAQVVGHTWKFVRVDGGPDRRFNNNRQIPICHYQAVRLRLSGNYERTFSKSRVSRGNDIAAAFKRMAEILDSLRVVTDLAALPAPSQF